MICRKPVPPSMKYLDEADAKDAQSEALEDEALALLAGIHGPDSKELQDLAMSKAVEADGIAKEANRLREEAFSLARLMERDTGKLEVQCQPSKNPSGKVA